MRWGLTSIKSSLHQRWLHCVERTGKVHKDQADVRLRLFKMGDGSMQQSENSIVQPSLWLACKLQQVRVHTHMSLQLGHDKPLKALDDQGCLNHRLVVFVGARVALPCHRVDNEGPLDGGNWVLSKRVVEQQAEAASSSWLEQAFSRHPGPSTELGFSCFSVRSTSTGSSCRFS